MTSDQMLGLLAHRVHEARSQVERSRHGPTQRDQLASAQRALLDALVEYVGALERRELPVPRRIRDDLRLHRELFGRSDR